MFIFAYLRSSKNEFIQIFFPEVLPHFGNVSGFTMSASQHIKIKTVRLYIK